MKIKTLSLTDFRAFPGPARAAFELDGKNLLVYGENGSGKSSLFKALSGFFAYGPPPPRLRELKNSFSGQSLGNVGVQVALDNGFTATWCMQLVAEIKPYSGLMYHNMVFAGPSLKEDHPAHRRTEIGMVEIEQAAKFSACLDYRTLLGTNYKHGNDAINLFDAIVSELLAGFVDLASNKTILDLWRAVERSLPSRNTSTNLFASFNACQQFNAATKRALALLLPEAQAILQRLCPDGLELKDLSFDGVHYNGGKLAREKAYLGKIVGLEIAYRGLPIERPQHYLNEARQSAIGLALYLGARLACAPQTTPHLKLLVLDDVLVGLDHSNRLPVLNVLVDLFANWQTAIDEALLSEDQIQPEKRDDWREVRNYIDAVNTAVSELKNLPLSNRLLRNTHEILMRGVRGEHKYPGEFRTTQNWIGGSNLADAAFIPPHPNEVADLMSDLENFWHNEAIAVPHLVRVALAHYQFETIHPFSDGNGRIGRLVIPLYLVSHGLLAKPSLYLSDFFERNRASYYDALMRVRISNDLIHWVRFFLTGMAETAAKGRDVFRQVLQLRSDIEHEVMSLGKRAPLAKQALNYLYKKPVTSAGDLATALGVSSPTINALIRELISKGILIEISGQLRGRVYAFDAYLKLFVS